MSRQQKGLPLLEESLKTTFLQKGQLFGLQGGMDETHDRQKVYEAEKMLLKVVREGDINYHRAFDHSRTLSAGVPVKGKDPLRQAKTSIVVFTTLVGRAAMEGGLSPEIAYPVGDIYIQKAEDSTSIQELEELANAMIHDFIYRVHDTHANPAYSYVVRRCCDYFELNMDKKADLSDLARLTGYSVYYLSEKFHKETGKTVNQYIRALKIDRAKMLLANTDLCIQEISAQLAFHEPSYLIYCFRQSVGMTPAQYRRMAKEKDVV